jgi:hypothetical protein
MTEEQRNFVRMCGPYRAIRPGGGDECLVRDRLGTDIAKCDDRDWAEAIAGALNEAGTVCARAHKPTPELEQQLSCTAQRMPSGALPRK